MNATNSVFAQLTLFGPAWVLFLNALNFTNTQIGFLLSLLPFTGLVALVIAPSVARFGYKRTFVTFFGLRKVAFAGLLLVPLLMPRMSPESLFLYVTLIVGAFALGRSIRLRVGTVGTISGAMRAPHAGFRAESTAVAFRSTQRDVQLKER